MKIELILIAAFIAVFIRGLYLNFVRERMLKKWLERIIMPMDYVVELQEQGFFRMLYETGEEKNPSYIDSTFVRSRQFFLDVMAQYDDTIIWKCFIGNPRLGRFKEIFNEAEPSCRMLYISVYDTVAAATTVMMQKHMSTWDEYAQYLMDNKTDKED